MTITLDQIRDTKFHVAKRGGYEVTEVDRFVDEVEESFAQLTEENASLRQQVEALTSAQANAQRSGAGQAPVSAEDSTREQPRVEAAPPVREQAATPAPRPPAPPAPPAPTAATADTAQQAVVGSASGPLAVTTTPEASAAVVRMVQLHTEQVETMEAEAKAQAKAQLDEASTQAKAQLDQASAQAKSKVDEANSQAEKITTEAKGRADKLEADAKTSADKLVSDAQRSADDLGRQVDARRTELFTALETERDDLQGAVDKLRDYEAKYRTNFAQQLRDTLDTVEGSSSEPAEAPTAKRSTTGQRSADGGSTPRLDALLGDNNR